MLMIQKRAALEYGARMQYNEILISYQLIPNAHLLTDEADSSRLFHQKENYNSGFKFKVSWAGVQSVECNGSGVLGGDCSEVGIAAV